MKHKHISNRYWEEPDNISKKRQYTNDEMLLYIIMSEGFLEN